MNIPNYKENPRIGLNYLHELDLLDGYRSVSKHFWTLIRSANADGYGKYRDSEYWHTLAACMRARIEVAAARRYLENEKDYEEDVRLVCSFCGQDETEVGHMIRAADQSHDLWLSLRTKVAANDIYCDVSVPVAICDQCVALCVEVLAEKRAKALKPLPPTNHEENPHDHSA